MKSPGQLDYEADVVKRPRYHDGTPRKRWDQLSADIRMTWDRSQIHVKEPSK